MLYDPKIEKTINDYLKTSKELFNDDLTFGGYYIGSLLCRVLTMLPESDRKLYLEQLIVRTDRNKTDLENRNNRLTFQDN